MVIFLKKRNLTVKIFWWDLFSLVYYKCQHSYTQPSYIYVAYFGHLKFNYNSLMEFYVFYGKREVFFI